MKQYFTEDNDFIDDERTILFNEGNLELSFKTNSGMFSKDHIDNYSISLVQNIEANENDEILDLGCGYGFIGIYLQKKFNSFVTFIDITSRACEYTKINCELNDITKFDIIQSDGIKIDKEFDIITLNPPIHAGKENIYRLYQEAIEHLTLDGSLYIVVHKKHGAKSTIEYLNKIAREVIVISKKKSLYIIEVKK